MQPTAQAVGKLSGKKEPAPAGRKKKSRLANTKPPDSDDRLSPHAHRSYGRNASPTLILYTLKRTK